MRIQEKGTKRKNKKRKKKIRKEKAVREKIEITPLKKISKQQQ